MAHVPSNASILRKKESGSETSLALVKLPRLNCMLSQREMASIGDSNTAELETELYSSDITSLILVNAR